jgi:hypothetical protein
MCLEKISEEKIATEDIVVYKAVKTRYQQEHFEKYHGLPFRAKIKDLLVTGRICFEANFLYFCTDSPKLNGCYCRSKFGYAFSWRLDDAVELESVYINDEKIDISIITFKTPYYDAEVKVGETYYSAIEMYEDTIERALHSYAMYPDVSSSYIIVECIIPKGSIYYEGSFGGQPGMASDTLKYVKIVKK